MPDTRNSPARLDCPASASRLPALQECASALLRVVTSGSGATEEVALLVSRDPVLFLELLSVAPLDRDERANPLKAIEQRIAQTDSGLLQAWFLRHTLPQPRQRNSHLSRRHLNLHSLLVAELATHLARETAYPSPEDAYVTGLLHDLGQLWLAEHAEDYLELRASVSDERALSAAEWERYGTDHSAISAQLASHCGLSPSIADAITLHQASPDELSTAHPLVRLTAAAEELASYRSTQSADSLSAASRLSGLDGSVLVSLLADVAPIINDAASDLGIVAEPAMLALPWSQGPDKTTETANEFTGIARAALGAFARGAFSSPEAARNGLERATRLILGLEAPVLFVRAAGSKVLTGAPSAALPALDQIRIACDDEGSAIAEAFRNSRETRYQCATRPPGRSAADWQVARWLDNDGLLCVPWKNHHDTGVAVFPFASRDTSLAENDAGLRSDLVFAATLRLSEERANETLRRELEKTISRRYTEHSRRLAHEASNPLTVIKTYLGIIDERINDTAIREQLAVLNDELDRIGVLVRKAPDFSAPDPGGPAQSGVAEILHDLRALYGDALFARRGIQFEMRTVADLPPAAIPPDALKQILINLFKNAAEAIPEGGKLVVTVGSGINANGTACLEIRVVDNGPGLPADRIDTLFNGSNHSSPEEGGIGLPLVKDLVTSNEGTILCRSQLGSGTVFQIFIPLAAST